MTIVNIAYVYKSNEKYSLTEWWDIPLSLLSFSGYLSIIGIYLCQRQLLLLLFVSLFISVSY